MTGRQRISVRRQFDVTRAEWMRQHRIRAQYQAVHIRASTTRNSNRVYLQNQQAPPNQSVASRTTISHNQNLESRRQPQVPVDDRDWPASTGGDSVEVQQPQPRSRRNRPVPAAGDGQSVGTKWTSYDRIQEINRTMGFAPLSETDSRRLEEEAKEQFNDAALDRKVCVVKDTWVFPKEATLLPIDCLPFEAMRKVLTGEPWVTGHISKYYDCSDLDVRCQGLLLSRRAFIRDQEGNVQVWISRSALQDLQALNTRLAKSFSSDNEHKPPKYAIADGFVAGVFQEVDDATVIERQAVSLTQIRGVVKVVYGGPGNMLQSHLLCWDNRDATIVSQIPNVVGRDHFQLILAGPMTPAQDILLARRHECDGKRVDKLHQLLKKINPLYTDISDNLSFTSQCADTSRLHANDDTDALIAQARARQSTVARMHEGRLDGEGRDTTIVESETVLMETITARTEHDRLAAAYANVTGLGKCFVARRSTTFLSNTDPRYLERLFPHLFTFGIGGFAMTRHHRYSQRAVVLHYLNMATNRFAEDPIFKLAMFDHLSTMRVKNGVYLRIGQDPALATTVMKVSPAQLKTVMSNRANQRAAWKQGKTYIPVPESSLSRTVHKSVHAATAKMWGSNEERESMTRKVDSMTIMYGAPSVFWTLTPNPDCSITCAFWTGHQLPGGDRPPDLSKCVEKNMPCSSQMARLIMANTVVQAQYYQVCCRLLIDVLFGWDMAAKKPKAERGIFGIVEALVYALEQQGRLFIHHHGVAWIAGFPRTQSDWVKLLDDPDLRERFEHYCESIFAAELPVYDAIDDDVTCPRDDCDGSLEPIVIHKKYKHLLKSSVAVPMVAACSSCHMEFSEADIVSAIIKDQWDKLSDEQKSISSTEAVESIRHRFGGLSADKRTANIQLTKLLLKDQVHAYAHARSCIKGRTSTKCRYNFFRDTITATGFNNDDEIEYKRRVGNQWLNPYISLWRRIFHFNMDARVLWSGHGLQATRYALQYTVKRQTVLDNVAVVELAFRRRIERETLMDATEYTRGVGRLLALTYSNSGVMEIGGPLATAILIEGEAVTFGCVFEQLILVEGLNILNQLDVQAMVVTRGDQLFTETCIGRYLQRPRCLEQYCWYDYCSWFHKVGTPTIRHPHACNFTPTCSTELRDHVKQHNLVYSEYPRVPEIIGPRLPDATRLEQEDYLDQSELYYRMSILLYKPFRNLDTILSSSNSAKSHFDAWRPLDDARTARALERHQQHYICLDMAEQYRAKQRMNSDANSDDEEVCLDADVLQYDASRVQVERSSHQYATIPPEEYDVGIVTDLERGDVARQHKEARSSPMHHLLLHSIVTSPLPPDNTNTYVASAVPITRAQITNFNPRGRVGDVLGCGEQETVRQQLRTTTVVIEDFEHATRDLRYQDTCTEHVQVGQYASISDISRHYRLNRSQHAAFVHIALPLLSSITAIPLSGSRMAQFDQSPLIITGAGGTGKSRVIEAVRTLASSWNRPGSIMVVASTGIAAASLQGCTMHNSVGLGINTTRLPKRIETPSDTLLRQWAPILCVIADEVSMTDLSFFGLWEDALRHAKENLDEPYGGLLAVLMFDHCQLRTVKGMPMYKTTSGVLPLTPTQDRGRHLYRSIKKVVYLTENMRFTQDAEWGQWLASARLGNWTPQIRSFIQSLPEFSITQPHHHQGMIQTISSDNSTRTIINEAAIGIAVASLAQDHRVYVVPARLSRPLSPLELTVIKGLPDNKTGNIPIFLHMYIGMPVRIKTNQCLPKGVVNGACGHIHHIDWAPSTSFRPQPNGTWLASIQPNNVYIDIYNSPNTTPFPGLPEDWPCSVMPVYQVTAAVTMKGTPVSIKGFPVVPAFGTTVHGVQGETRAAIAITSLRPQHVRNVDPHALYVALSRVTTRHGLHWVGERPTASDFDYFHPDTEVLIEDHRLKTLSKTTLALFGQFDTP